LNKGGKLYLTHTKLEGVLTLRLVVAQTNTRAHHVRQAWQQIQAAADELDAL